MRCFLQRWIQLSRHLTSGSGAAPRRVCTHGVWRMGCWLSAQSREGGQCLGHQGSQDKVGSMPMPTLILLRGRFGPAQPCWSPLICTAPPPALMRFQCCLSDQGQQDVLGAHRCQAPISSSQRVRSPGAHHSQRRVFQFDPQPGLQVWSLVSRAYGKQSIHISLSRGCFSPSPSPSKNK